MKKFATGLLMVVMLLVGPATPGHAQRHSGGHSSGGFHGGGHAAPSGHGGFHGGGGWHGGWRGGVFIGGPWWWGGPWSGWPYPYAYPYAYYPPPYDAYPPAVEGPSAYIEQAPAQSSERVQGYWYFCASAKGYYPTVPKCPEAWIKVPPAPQ